MEQINSTYQLMEMISKPTFCVKDATIVYTNQAARSMHIRTETPVESLLPNNYEAYKNFNGGCLYLTVRIAGIDCNATITRGADCDFFTLEDPMEKDQLRALSLAGQQLRIPLAGLVATIDAMLDQRPTASTRQYGDQIRKGVHRIHRIVNNMSDAGYLESGTSATEILDFSAMVAESVEKANTLLAESGHNIIYKDIDRKIYTRGNRNLLNRAVYNMLSNAIKFSDPGCPIHVELSQSNQQLVLRICNTSRNTRSEMLATAFNNYQRKPTVEDSRTGIGLGMPLIRAAARAHNGTVLIDQPKKDLVRVTLSIEITTDDNPTTLRNPVMLQLDYAGGRDHALLELSDLLPAKFYKHD